MADKKFYVICDDDCKAEAMTKEQTLAAIKQIMETGEVGDVDTGFVTKIVEQNAKAGLKFWVGTSAEYNALTQKENNCFYIITDDTDNISIIVEELQNEVKALQAELDARTKPVVLYEGELHKGDTVTIEDFEKYNIFAVELRKGENVSILKNSIVLCRESNSGLFENDGTEMLSGGNLVYNGTNFTWYGCALTINDKNIVTLQNAVVSDWGATGVVDYCVTKITGLV